MRRTLGTAAVLVVTALLLSACGDDSSGGTPPPLVPGDPDRSDEAVLLQLEQYLADLDESGFGEHFATDAEAVRHLQNVCPSVAEDPLAIPADSVDVVAARWCGAQGLLDIDAAQLDG